MKKTTIFTCALLLSVTLPALRQAMAAPETVEGLYRRAFQEFGAQSLWSRKPIEHPTIAQALAIADALRREGNMKSRPLAAKIEEACRASL